MYKKESLQYMAVMGETGKKNKRRVRDKADRKN